MPGNRSGKCKRRSCPVPARNQGRTDTSWPASEAGSGDLTQRQPTASEADATSVRSCLYCADSKEKTRTSAGLFPSAAMLLPDNYGGVGLTTGTVTILLMKPSCAIHICV